MRSALLAGGALLLALVAFQLGRQSVSHAGEPEPLPKGSAAPATSSAADPKQPKPPKSPPKDRPEGRWHRKRASASPAGSGPQSALVGVGYSGAYENAAGAAGARTHLASAVQPGLTLFSTGHGNSVHLIDEAGADVHTWRLDYDELFPDPLGFSVSKEHKHFVRRAYPLANGDLIAVFEYIGIVKVDRKGSRIWARPKGYHHDFEIQADGSIVTLGSSALFPEDAAKRYRTNYFKRGIADAAVVFLRPDGTEKQRISVMDALYQSDFAAFMGHLPAGNADVLHANSVDVVAPEIAAVHPALNEGDVLVSLRSPGAIIAIDPKTERVTWLLHGAWRMQHQATALANGRVLLLDNRGGNAKAPLRFNQSRVLEWDPTGHRIAWQYPPAGEDLDFHTHKLGYVERLANGNTLITESTQGHLLEVTPQGQMAWEYYSPHRAGEDGELITTLMGGRRIRRDDLPFLDD